MRKNPRPRNGKATFARTRLLLLLGLLAALAGGPALQGAAQTDDGPDADGRHGAGAHASMKLDAGTVARWCVTPAGRETAQELRDALRQHAHGGGQFQMACMMALLMHATERNGDATADHERMYLLMMLPHHAGAIQMARLAEERSSRPEIVTLSREIVRVQQTEMVTLRGWLDQWYPGAARAMEVSPLAFFLAADPHGLDGLSGEAFDRAFLDAMIHHHLMAVHMSDHAIDFAARSETRDFAAGVIRTQEAEVHQMRLWRATWFGGPAPPAPA